MIAEHIIFKRNKIEEYTIKDFYSRIHHKGIG